jgi:hypothetical protein
MRIRLGLRIQFRRMMIGERSNTLETGEILIMYSLRCIQVISGVLGRAGEAGQQKRLEAAKTGKATWEPPEGLGAPFTDKDGAPIIAPASQGVESSDSVLEEIRTSMLKGTNSEEDD